MNYWIIAEDFVTARIGPFPSRETAEAHIATICRCYPDTADTTFSVRHAADLPADGDAAVYSPAEDLAEPVLEFA